MRHIFVFLTLFLAIVDGFESHACTDLFPTKERLIRERFRQGVWTVDLPPHLHDIGQTTEMKQILKTKGRRLHPIVNNGDVLSIDWLREFPEDYKLQSLYESLVEKVQNSLPPEVRFVPEHIEVFSVRKGERPIHSSLHFDRFGLGLGIELIGSDPTRYVLHSDLRFSKPKLVQRRKFEPTYLSGVYAPKNKIGLTPKNHALAFLGSTGANTLNAAFKGLNAQVGIHASSPAGKRSKVTSDRLYVGIIGKFVRVNVED